MSLRTAYLGLASSLVLAATLAGCAEPPLARFADASPAQLERAYRAASRHDVASAILLGMLFSGEHQPTGCPAIVTEGQDTTVTGGCTLDNGARLEGVIAMHNMPAWGGDFPAHDRARPRSIELDFHIQIPQREETVLDGRIELEPKSRSSSELTLDTEGIATTTRIEAACDAQQCAILDGSEIELSELGRASIEAAWSLTSEGPDTLTLRGADVLVFDLAGEVGSCVPYTLGDERGTVCVPTLDDAEWFEPLPIPE